MYLTQEKEADALTRFERDLQDALGGNEIEVLQKRKEEIEKLKHDLVWCKNGFRRQCIQQEIDRLTKQYDEIDSHF